MKRIIISLFGSLLLLVSITPATVYASAASDAACEGAGAIASADTCGDSGSTTVTDLVTIALRILQVVAGIAAVIMVIFGGISFITSRGEPAKLATARNTIIYACIGIVVVALAQVIIQFVLNRVDTTTGSQTNNSQIGTPNPDIQ